MQTPLTFFLELLVIALFVTAAAGPAMVRHDAVRPLLVVLDDSYSMLAHDKSEPKDTPRKTAEAAVVEELQHGNYSARFVLAGVQSRLIGETAHDSMQMQKLLSQWACHNPAADLPAAMALAAELGGPSARILVLSDHAPSGKLTKGQTQWWSFGVKRPNMAFTAATRTPSGESQRVLLEVTNLSDTPATGTLTIDGGNLAAPRQDAIELSARAARQFFLSVPTGSPALRANLADDALDIDNHVALLPEADKPIRVWVDIADSRLKKAVVRALEATAQTIRTTERPELIIADKSADMQDDAWRLELLGGAKPNVVAYAGPFVMDRNHRLTEGLSLQQAIWSVPSDMHLDGRPIVTAGNVSLLTEGEDIVGHRRLQMPLAADQSNIEELPDWPIFFANLIAWRRSGLPGTSTPNVRLGETVDIALAGEPKQVEIISPTGRRNMTIRGRHVAVPAECVGRYDIRAPNAEYAFSCNAVHRDESDLADCESGRWGSWNDSPVYQDRRIDLSWILMVVALAAITGHLAIVAHRSERSGA
jgi:hypothetical protein